MINLEVGKSYWTRDRKEAIKIVKKEGSLYLAENGESYSELGVFSPDEKLLAKNFYHQPLIDLDLVELRDEPESNDGRITVTSFVPETMTIDLNAFSDVKTIDILYGEGRKPASVNWTEDKIIISLL